MSFLANYDDLRNEYKSQGIKEGIERSKLDSYNQGFRDGVLRGIEKGVLLSFISTVALFANVKARIFRICAVFFLVLSKFKSKPIYLLVKL